MELTLYELLGLIKDNKAPKKIRCFGHDYEFSISDEGIDYIEIDKEAGERYLTDVIGDNYLGFIFSTTVEVLEEEKEIEEFKLQCTIANHYSKENIQCLANEMVRKMNKLREKLNNLKKEGK